MMKSRIYYLFDAQKQSYHKLTSTKGLIRRTSFFGGESLPISDLKNLFRSYLSEKNFSSFLINTPLKKVFWQKADKRMKQALVFSYYRYLVKKDQLVVNVEVDDWLKIPFFKDYYHRVLAGISLKSNLADCLRAFVATTGIHLRSLRFENIHLVQDIVRGQLISTVHYDRYWPGFSLFSLTKHFLLES